MRRSLRTRSGACRSSSMPAAAREGRRASQSNLGEVDVMSRGDDRTPTTPIDRSRTRSVAWGAGGTAHLHEDRGRTRQRGRSRHCVAPQRHGALRGLLAALVGAAIAAWSLASAQLVSEAPRPEAGPAETLEVPSSIALDARSFAPGGCVALPPSGSTSRGTVLVDAGHGGPDPGSLGTTLDGRTVAEKDLTLPVALTVASRLRAVGITPVLSRSTDELGSTIESDEVQNGSLTTAASQEDLVARVRCANIARADALVSVHFNSFDDPAVRGSETLYDVDRQLAPRSRALAQSLQSNIRTGLATLGAQSPDRGVIDDSSGGEARGGDLVLLGPGRPGSGDEASSMPGALVEPLFLTNPGDLTTVATPRGVDVLAGAISSGVEDYLDEERR
ncbi:N-acetylmuramoyl-L-alanine amidase [Actinomycetospora rhizophila]|uniref:N-acetylmuramoyl-L-alanine amidase n=1 Tax=Actinomycetospora rhizophila TaxID=1416876 RepID=A0ABV9Z969_9PSEU